jgi:TonB-linked SusC/RagA family outer membrane protein
MKCSFLLVFITLLWFSANASGQPLVSIHLKNVEINQVLSTLEKESGYHFLFNSRLEGIHKLVNVDVDNADISQVLNSIFAGTRLQYKILENRLIVVSSSDVAQDIQVSGRITNESNEPLSGVSVTVKGKTTGTTTDQNGNFSITTSDNATIVISYVGYTTQELPATAVMDVKLSPSTKIMDQVVVVGYGTQRKLDITGATATVKGAELVKQPVTTATQALQGKMAGVQIISAGQPGALPVVRIRGVGTMLSGADPLYVVDGILTNDITNINTSDIVDVTVLKDASSEAIYGVRAANGVIIITTKQGVSGKIKVNYFGYFGVRSATNLVKMANSQEYIDYVQASLGPTVAPTGYSTDWFGSFLRNGFEQTHNISLSGGSENNKFLFSAGYINDQGIVIDNSYKRWTFRLNDEYKINSVAKFGFNASFANAVTQSVNQAYNSTNGTQNQGVGSSFSDAYRASPTIPAKIGNRYGNTSVFQNVGNPILDIENNNNRTNDNRTQGTGYVEIKPISWLTFRSALSGDLDIPDNRTYNYAFAADTSTFITGGGNQSNSKSNLTVGNLKRFHWLWDNTLTFNKRFDKSNLTVLAGIVTEEASSNYNTSYRQSVPANPNLWYIPEGDPQTQQTGPQDQPTIAANIYNWTRLSYIGRANYSYNDRYLLTATIRADGSSLFPPQNRWAYSPSIGVGWIVTKEGFMENQKIFDMLKIKGSWGKVGNDNVPVGSFTNTLTPNLPYFFGGTASGGVAITQLKDQNLTWEQVEETDIGLEFSMLKQRFTGEINYYNKVNNNALINVVVPSTLGSQPSYVLTNAASIQNQGVEVSLRWSEPVNSSFSYYISGNITYNNNNVVGLNGGQPYIDGPVGADQPFVTKTDNGHPVGSFYVQKVLGVFQNQGEINSYTDKNGNILQSSAQPGDFKYEYSPDGKLDSVFAGSYQPKFYFGLSLGFTYKAFDFSVDFYGNVGNKIYNGKKALRQTSLDNIEESTANDRWTQKNPTNSEPRANGGNLPASTYFVESGDFYRINNINIGYTLPPSVIQKLKVISSLRIFFTSQNPVTIQEYSGFSSELPGSPTSSGIELNPYPTTKTFAVGVNLGL